MTVTRVAFSHRLNAGKYAALAEQGRRLGRVRSEVWQRYGSVGGAGLRDRQVRDRWLATGTHQQFEVLANAWKETVRDAMADIARGDHGKADRIHANNLGTVKRERRRARWEAMVRTEIFTAVHRVVDKAAVVVAEDLTKTFTGRKKLGKNTNRRLAAWTKGVTAEALTNVSERRGSALRLVNAAYTSQVVPCCKGFGRRSGDRLHCTPCRVVWHADHAGAINVQDRLGDPDITLHTPYRVVKQILLARTDRQRTGLPVPDSSRPRVAESEISVPLSNEQ